jgi:hypothetical protein
MFHLLMGCKHGANLLQMFPRISERDIGITGQSGLKVSCFPVWSTAGEAGRYRVNSFGHFSLGYGLG